MNERDDVFKRFQKSFSGMNGHFHILEQRVPVELQMEYFKYSEKLRNRVKLLTDEDMESIKSSLWELESDPDNKRFMLTSLAISRQVKAYRMLEEYVQHPDPEMADWACMALMESRISLESELSDEKQIYISTGLGGKGEKLRFYVLLLSVDQKPFQNYQRQVIERECSYYLTKEDCEIERLTIREQYVELVFLIPVRRNIKTLLDQVINECNQYGGFLSDVFTVTNVKELNEKEIAEIINKNGDSKASD